MSSCFKLISAWTPRPLQDDDIILCRQAPVRPQYFGDQCLFIGKIVPRTHDAPDLAVYDHLGAGVIRRLEEDGVHLHSRGDARRLCLHHLRPPHLQAS